MNRSGYNDCGYGDQDEQWGYIRYRGAVTSSLRGRRGQAFLKELRDTLDAMEDKILIEDKLEADGQYCTLGCVLHARGADIEAIEELRGEYDPDWGYEEDQDNYWSALADALNISETLAREIMYENDECIWSLTKPKDSKMTDEEWDRRCGERRWAAVRAWVDNKIAS